MGRTATRSTKEEDVAHEKAASVHGGERIEGRHGIEQVQRVWTGEESARAVSILRTERWFNTGFKSRQELEVGKDEFYERYNEERRIQGKEAIDRLVEEEDSEKARARAKAKSA
ncbi:Ski complex subunit Rec14 [Friedmanniomyces endolithicus]|nr:Ski complex subunit Rec14 [Friedmanniomyces endolithicus]